MRFEMMPFKADDINEINPQPANISMANMLSREHWLRIEQQRFSYTMRVEGRVVACTGVFEYWPGRGEVWAILDKDCKEEFLYIHKAAKRFFEVCPVNRIEATVELGFPEGHRWMRLLGFELEAPVLKKYFPNGSDCSLYAKVRN